MASSALSPLLLPSPASNLFKADKKVQMSDTAEMNFFSNPDELKSAMLEQALQVL